MLILPWRESFIRKNFIEHYFSDDLDFTPDFKKFQTLSSSEQYYLANYYNWDDGAEVLKWIIESSKCDKGTAGLIFWKAEPDFYISQTKETIPDYEKDVFELLQLIVNRFNKNDFKSNRFKYDIGSSLKYIDFNKITEDWKLPNELQFTHSGIVPISLGLLRTRFAEYQRQQMLKKREARKDKRKK